MIDFTKFKHNLGQIFDFLLYLSYCDVGNILRTILTIYQSKKIRVTNKIELSNVCQTIINLFIFNEPYSTYRSLKKLYLFTLADQQAFPGTNRHLTSIL